MLLTKLTNFVSKVHCSPAELTEDGSMATIRKRNNSYHVQIRKQGHPTLTKSFRDKATALAWIKKTESEIERELYLDISVAQRTSLNEVLTRFKDEVLPTKKSGITDLSRIKFLQEHFGNQTLSDLKPYHIAQYRDSRLKKVKPATVLKEIGLLSRVLNACTKDWGIALPSGNPVSQIRLPKSPHGRDRRLSKDEEQAVISALHKTPMVSTIVQIALETGMRRGEILGIESKHIDLQNRTLHIPKTKTDTPRTIPLSVRAVELISGYLTEKGPIFSIAAYSVTQAFRRACRRIGLTNIRFHDLRHEATTRFFEIGLNPVEVATITGHRDTRMLMRYTHLRAEDLAVKLSRL